jgi:hypothetical protein
VVEPADAKKALVPYDSARVLALMANKDPFPAVCSKASDLTKLPAGLVGRSQPVVRPKSAAEFMATSRNDEG